MTSHKTLNKTIESRLKAIHELSAKINSGDHNKKLLKMMRSHIDEIEELHSAGNPHSITETGDLLILCLEYILENNSNPSEVIEICLDRFERKLNSLI